MKKFYIIAVILVVCLVLSPLIFLADVFKEVHPKGMLYWNTYESAVKSIDAATCGDVTSATIQGNFYESLYAYHFLKRPLEVEPQLALSMPDISADGFVYTIKIRPGIFFHRNPCFGKDSGDPQRWATRELRAEDFVLGFKRVADYHINTGLAWAFLANRIVGLDEFREKTKQFSSGDFARYDLPVEGLRAVDSQTLQLTLTEPFPQFVNVLAINVYAPTPREAVEYWLTTDYDKKGNPTTIPIRERSPEFLAPQQVVGTGPHQLTTFKRKWKIILDRHPDFRDEFYPAEGEPASADWPGDSALGLLQDAGKKVPFFDRVYLRYVEETYASWMLFLSGQRGVAGIPQETFESVISPGKTLSDSWGKKGIKLITTTDPAIYWINFNMEDSVLGASKSLRQALCLGYDVENEIQILLNGRAKRAVNVVPSSLKGHKEAGPGPYFRYDLAAAKAKIIQARTELKAVGRLVKDEIPELKIDLSDGPQSLRMADFARQQFNLLGIKLKIVFNDWPTLQRKIENKQVQMYSMGWHADYPDAENFLQLYYSGNIDKGTNNANYRNPLYDSLYTTVRVMQDSPRRTAIYCRMIQIISEDCPSLLLYEPENFYLYYDWMRNIKPHPIGYGFNRYRRIDEIRKRHTS
jgi:oligopeptide transport system substrate-binding protein